MKILDATCGARGIWYQKNHPFVTFMDKRNGTFKAQCKRNGIRTMSVKVNPDLIGDWTKELPFEDGHFDMVVFDPPHIVRKNQVHPGILENQYGYLKKDTFRTDLQKGFVELFRILKDNGILILKWADHDFNLQDLLKLVPYPPMFGTRTGQKNKTHWVLFIKHRIDENLSNYSPDQEKGGLS
jgi:SAM-dependent methyltransferase